MLSLACLGQAKKGPARLIAPEDVVQDSIRLIAFSTPPNTFCVIWTYTTTGANKTLAAWEADGNHYGITPEFKRSWINHPIDREFFLIRAAAEEFVTKLKMKERFG